MKFAKVINDKKEFGFLILETTEDVQSYKEINEKVKSKQAVGFWFGFKSQNFRQTMTDYCAHEVESNNKMAHFMATTVTLRNEKTSIVDYCNIADNLLSDMHARMYRMASEGKMVRINHAGGYCPIDNLKELTEVQDINNLEMYNFILHNDINYDFSIKSENIVIENAPYIPKDLIKKVVNSTKIKEESIQVINSFKLRTILFKKEDFISLFLKGMVHSNLKNIIFATTSQDRNQITAIKNIFEYISKAYPKRKLNFYIEAYKKDRHLFETELKNININFID